MPVLINILKRSQGGHLTPLAPPWLRPGCGLLLLLMVASDGYLAMICLVGLDLTGFGFGISVWCSNGGFGGLVWCFNMSLVVEERDRDEEMREKSTVFLYYLFCSLYYFIESYVKIRTEMLGEL